MGMQSARASDSAALVENVNYFGGINGDALIACLNKSCALGEGCADFRTQ